MDILSFTTSPDAFLALQRAIHHPWQETYLPWGSPYLTTQYAGLELALIYLSPRAIADLQYFIPLVTKLQPRLLTLVGVCQGLQDRVALGDIIVAQQVLSLATAQAIRLGDRAAPWQASLLGQPLNWQWQVQIPRPKSAPHQRGWLLHTLYDHELKPDHCLSPQEHPERQHHCPDWPLIFGQLVAEQLLNPDPLRLTAMALDLIREDQLLHLATGFPHDPVTSTVHLGAIADIIQVEPFTFGDFDILSAQPQILGLDVGSYAIAALAAQVEQPLMIIRAVQSYHPLQPQDPFRAYAAATATQFFLGFLRNLTHTTVPNHS